MSLKLSIGNNKEQRQSFGQQKMIETNGFYYIMEVDGLFLVDTEMYF